MELNPTLFRIDSLKKEAESLQPAKPEWERVFWDKFRLEFNYNSNHMEGNTLTYGHTQILLKSGDVVGKYNIRELEEMKAHDLALKIIRESAGDPEFSLSQKFIKEINQLILVEPFYNEAITADGKPTQKLITPGEYKKTPNSVRLPNGEMYYYPSPEETPALMGDLIDWYQKEAEAEELHTVQLAALFHYKLVRIHPFDDSNGRTARLLMNYILLKNDYAPLVIESADKKNYLIALNEADAGNLEAFITYITNLSLRWQELFLKATKGEKIEEEGDFDKEIELLKKRMSDNDRIQQTFTRDAVVTLFHRCFLVLFDKLILKLASLDNLFYSKAIHFGFNNKNFVILKIEQIERLLEQYSERIILNGSIDFQYIHKGLSGKSTDITDVYSSIRIKLFEYTYRIESDQIRGSLIEKKYNEVLSETEINQIIDIVSKKSLEDIKSHI